MTEQTANYAALAREAERNIRALRLSLDDAARMHGADVAVGFARVQEEARRADAAEAQVARLRAELEHTRPLIEAVRRHVAAQRRPHSLMDMSIVDGVLEAALREYEGRPVDGTC